MDSFLKLDLGLADIGLLLAYFVLIILEIVMKIRNLSKMEAQLDLVSFLLILEEMQYYSDTSLERVYIVEFNAGHAMICKTSFLYR